MVSLHSSLPLIFLSCESTSVTVTPARYTVVKTVLLSFTNRLQSFRMSLPISKILDRFSPLIKIADN